jgi:hypothetical protein
MASHLIPAAAVHTASRKAWALPERGLALFHGHPQAPRLFHYFLPRLIAEGKNVLCLDGGNRFDPLLVGRFARRAGRGTNVFNQQIRVARAFTCFQLTELLVRVPRFLEKFPAAAVVVTAFPDLYFDEDVREREAAASFYQALDAVRTLARSRLPVAVFSDAASFRTPRQKFFQMLMAQADATWRFTEREGGKLALVEEKAPSSVLGSALPSAPSPEPLSDAMPRVKPRALC